MFIKVFLILTIVFIYIQIIYHFNISNDNRVFLLNDVSRTSLHKTIYHKLPFYFNGITIPSSLKMNEYIEKTDHFTKVYESIQLLEPYVKYYPSHKIYKLKENKHIALMSNLECRNFYKISKGKVDIYLIHPKYSTLFKKQDHKYITNKKIIEFIKSNTSFIQLTLYKDSILFLPNYWLIFIVSIESSVVELIQYSTFMNKGCYLYEAIQNRYL